MDGCCWVEKKRTETKKKEEKEKKTKVGATTEMTKRVTLLLWDLLSTKNSKHNNKLRKARTKGDEDDQ